MSRTKSAYNDLSGNSYTNYRHPLMHAIALLLRFKFHHEVGQHIPGQFGLPVTKPMNDSRIALYDFLMSVSLGVEIDRMELGNLVHPLLVSLLTAKCKANDRIGHIFDVTIPIGLYKGDGIYRNVMCATKYCAWLQFCLRSVAIQCARLGSAQASYKPFLETSLIVHNEWPEDDDYEQNNLDWDQLDFVGDVDPEMRQIVKHASQELEPVFFVDAPGDDSDSSQPEDSSLLGSHPLARDDLLS